MHWLAEHLEHSCAARVCARSKAHSHEVWLEHDDNDDHCSAASRGACQTRQHTCVIEAAGMNALQVQTLHTASFQYAQVQQLLLVSLRAHTAISTQFASCEVVVIAATTAATTSSLKFSMCKGNFDRRSL